MEHDLNFFCNLVNKLNKEEKITPIIKPLSPGELRDSIDLSLTNKGNTQEVFEKNITDVVMATPRTSTRLFFNQLFGGRNSKAILGDLLSVVLNNGMHIYKVNGIQVLIEREIIKTIIPMIGYKKNISSGIFTPGGSMSNFMALLMARDIHDKNVRENGISKNMIVYTSDQSHYSMVKNIRFAGIGENNLRKIISNKYGQINIEVLENQIQKDIKDGHHPFFIKATAGTTVLGAFDDFEKISEICKKYNLWFHIDGALGGSTIFSDKYKNLMKGIKLSDSFAINAHKMLGVPISCSMIFTKNKKHMYNSFSSEADYLYQGDADDLNPGLLSLQCARTNDALKFWTLWKSIGTEGLAKIVEKEFYLADIARNYLRNNVDYTLYSFDNSTNICFNYKNYDAKKLCKILYKETELLISHGSFKGNTFLRLVTVRYENEKEDIINVFKTIERVAANYM